MKDTKPQIQEARKVVNRIPKTTPSCIIFKLQETKGKIKILKKKKKPEEETPYLEGKR